ncbi:TPA: hypothetical protein QDA98_003885 [Burkholderia vietnamiensis]|nr:hypothetical protein [Burkholderia vietnamiensis]
MGYNFTIGNAEAGELMCEEGEYTVPLTVPGLEHDDAPRDDSPTFGTNQRWPSYSGWNEFCRLTGLHAMFYDEDVGLIRRHPGVFELTPDHIAEIRAAHAKLKNGDPEVYAEQRGRMEWLEYWTQWALRNCERPAFKNT